MTETTTDILKGIHQVWYNEESRLMCADVFSHYHNKKLSPFFENSVIQTLCIKGKHLETEWFGVLSPKFFHKLPKISSRLTPAGIRKCLTDDIDLLAFTTFQNTNIITQGDNFHGKIKGNFSKTVQMIFEGAGIEWNVRQRLRFPVLMNYVIARGEIWDRYYHEMLGPCMEVMKNADGELKELLWSDVDYKTKNTSERNQVIRKLNELYGINHYPFHAFVCERFWSVFLEMNPDIRKRKYIETTH